MKASWSRVYSKLITIPATHSPPVKSFIQVQNSLWMHWWAIGPMSLSFVFISNLVHCSQQPFTSQYILPLTSFTKGCAQYNFEFGKGLSFKSNRSSINRVKMWIPHAYATRTAGASENTCFLQYYCMPYKKKTKNWRTLTIHSL